MGRSEMRTKLVSESLNGRGHLWDLGLNGMIILKCILEEYDVGM